MSLVRCYLRCVPFWFCSIQTVCIVDLIILLFVFWICVNYSYAVWLFCSVFLLNLKYMIISSELNLIYLIRNFYCNCIAYSALLLFILFRAYSHQFLKLWPTLFEIELPILLQIRSKLLLPSYGSCKRKLALCVCFMLNIILLLKYLRWLYWKFTPFRKSLFVVKPSGHAIDNRICICAALRAETRYYLAVVCVARDRRIRALFSKLSSQWRIVQHF